MVKRTIILAMIFFAFFWGNKAHAEEKRENFDPSKDFKFEFIAATTKTGVFINATEKEEYRLKGGVSEKEVEEKRGGKTEERKEVFYYTINPKFFEDVIVNRMNDKYTLIINKKITTLRTEKFYFESDIMNREGGVIYVKLIPENIKEITDFKKYTTKDILVIKQPHPKIEKVEVIPFLEFNVGFYEYPEVTKILQIKFNNFMKNESSSLDYLKFSEISFSKEPKITLYTLATGSEYRLFTASWYSDRGETGCCLSGLFELKKENGVIKLEEIISIENGKGLGGIIPVQLILLNQRKFVHTHEGGWEWGWGYFYELLPGQYPWKVYMRSETQ